MTRLDELMGVLQSPPEEVTRVDLINEILTREKEGRLQPPPANPATPSAGWNQGVRDTLHGMFVQPIQDAGRAIAGQMTDAEAQNFALEAAAGLIPLGKAGKAVKEALSSDTASRMARAQEMGFRLGMPLEHGNAPVAPFREFMISKEVPKRNLEPGSLAVWTAPQGSGVADVFALQKAKETGGNPQVMPLLHRAEKPAVVDLEGHEQNHEIASTLADAWANGYDAVMFKNYTAHGGKPQNIIAVKDPSQLRSPFAQFDPKKRNSRDLLAGIAGAAGLASISDVPKDQQ